MIPKFEHLFELNRFDTIEAVLEFNRETFAVKGSFMEFRHAMPIYGNEAGQNSHILIKTSRGYKIINLHADDETLSVHRTRIVIVEKYIKRNNDNT